MHLAVAAVIADVDALVLRGVARREFLKTDYARVGFVVALLLVRAEGESRGAGEERDADEKLHHSNEERLNRLSRKIVERLKQEAIVESEKVSR